MTERPSIANRIRPNVEAAPWVVEAVKNLEAELATLRARNAALVKVADAARKLVSAGGSSARDSDAPGSR